MTRLELHIKDWKNCHRCNLCQFRKNVVIGRGKLPCDVLFVGEAPGHSEDVNGDPFVGQAGRKMDEIIRKALSTTMSFAMTNLIGCIPLDEDRSKTVDPDTSDIQSCAPRLRDFVEMANPKLIICVGKLAAAWLNSAHLANSWKVIGSGPRDYTIHEGSKIPRTEIMHPSAIIRANVAQQSILTQRCVVSLRGAVLEYLS